MTDFIKEHPRTFAAVWITTVVSVGAILISRYATEKKTTTIETKGPEPKKAK